MGARKCAPARRRHPPPRAGAVTRPTSRRGLGPAHPSVLCAFPARARLREPAILLPIYRLREPAERKPQYTPARDPSVFSSGQNPRTPVPLRRRAPQFFARPRRGATGGPGAVVAGPGVPRTLRHGPRGGWEPARTRTAEAAEGGGGLRRRRGGRFSPVLGPGTHRGFRPYPSRPLGGGLEAAGVAGFSQAPKSIYDH